MTVEIIDSYNFGVLAAHLLSQGSLSVPNMASKLAHKVEEASYKKMSFVNSMYAQRKLKAKDSSATLLSIKPA
ncbi:hypothetical protein N7448_000842 [Penicillium atrosanguineum]|uniref:Uncharacterized protein n=1 Tax=Penicillium atrosanguineum TaxID=1132637 RepID=A0A9W9U7R5_9EURO|nr:uncharacterized protein N7443_004237 [Penicillium atrosanguineum]KAJ5134135.1 hypothetical protein N7526_005500 [Penicillium atrosanguineum]KAJ5149264.1 hypothetical protein N7448_000842 [Penicillium atrosanguineum]KAJ5304577.1 hypothetical protein N7443_004237 [Penicillium atrosanguineum]KAJ5324046.1 hypothetical protein N7476_002646 [Penicillium atrosanguineum]